MRKGLATLVSLTLVAVVWAWAATAFSTYWVETKTTSLGGSIKVANGTALSGVGAIKFSSFTTANAVPVYVQPAANYKISTVTVDNVVQTIADPTVTFTIPVTTPNHTVKVFAGFVGLNAANTGAKTWQLQLQNGSFGGTISVAGRSLGNYGMKMYNYSDTTPMPVTVTPATGYYVSSVYVNSVLQSSFPQAGGVYTIDPSAAGKVFNVTANYKPLVNTVTTNTASAANGILPVNPKVAYGKDVKLVVSPMAPYNTITALSLTGTGHGAVTMIDAQGNTSAPWKGSVVVTISAVTGPLTLGYTPGTDNTGQMQGCTSTCHMSASAQVQATAGLWNNSVHKRNAVDCVSCHNTMPGDVTAGTVSRVTLQKTDGSVYCTSCHSSSTAAGFLTSAHWTNTYNTSANAGCSQKCHFKSQPAAGCGTCHSGALASDGSFAQGTYSSAAAHNTQILNYNTTCTVCHAAGGKHGGPTDNFLASKHWNNSFEYGPEFAGGAVPEQINPNESYTTTEFGAATTCAYRCHFKPGMGPSRNVTGYVTNGRATTNVSYTDTLNNETYTRPGGDGCIACHDPHTSKAADYQTCLICHSGSKHGVVPNEFFNSKHWKNTHESGPEFAGQNAVEYGSYTFAGQTQTNGNVKLDAATVPGDMNPNSSYNTTENGAATTCAYRCHFGPGMGPQQNVAGYLANGKSITYIAYSSRASGQKITYTRPGGNACLACHDSHKLVTDARSTCYTCHAGGNHGWSVKAFEKSTHYTSTYAIYDGMGGPTGKACIACHNAHSLEAEFANVSSNQLRSAGMATGCQGCHTPGQSYSIFSSNGIGKAPHFKTDNTTAYMTPRTSCASCHSHNNTINAGWAEGGHGSTTTPAFDGSPSENFKTMGVAGVNYQVDPSARNCVRCHTANGFAQFVDSGFTNIAPVGVASDNTSEPIVCTACHNNVDKGTLRLANFTSQHLGGAKYMARYGYKNALANNVLVNSTLTLPDNKNSNVCLPCHSQRASGQEIKDVFALGNFKQYSAGSAIYPHAAQPAAIVAGMGGYEFTVQNGTSNNGFAYQDRARHQRIGNYGTGTGYNNTGVTQGNCVGCHMNTAGATHNLEIGEKDANGNFTSITSTACAKCHPSDFTYQNLNTRKGEFKALVDALGNLLVKKGITQDGVTPLAERKAFDMSLGTKDNAIAQRNMGAWYNWYLFNTTDPAAYAHNPSYARRLLTDSIDMLDDNTLNGSAAATVQAMGVNGNALYNANLNVANALTATNDPGCLGCHFGTTTNNLNGEAIPGVQGAPHYNTAATNVPGQTFTQAQFVVAGSQCNDCHGYGHGTDSPGYSASKAAFPNISGVQGKGINANYAESAHGDINGLAWTDYNFLNLSSRSGCTPCHTTKGFANAMDSVNANGGKIATPAFIGNAADTTKQVLGCTACHSSTSWKTSIRTMSNNYQAAQGGFSLTAPAYTAYENMGESNVCIPCHAGRENGGSINASTADFSNTGFKNPHYLAAAAVFYGKGGFQFYTSGVRYNTYGAAGKIGRTANWSHGKLGMDNYTTSTLKTANTGNIRGSGNKGQCVACHLGPTNTHTFNAFEAAKATWGTNTTPNGCFGCHSGEDMEEVAIGEKALVDRSLDLLAYELEKYGLYFNNDKNPYFFTDAAFTTSATNWTNNPNSVTVTGKQTMGAAQNLKLLKAEKGSHVHNRAFMRALITDSLVYLQKGQAGIDADRTVTSTDPNNLINFTNYSTAISAPNSDRIAAGQSGSSVSITALKGYLIRNGARR
ncbi:hypothetical protein L4X63_19340 [Geomonas sp. Red32]|uniref:hypothetical protein n=1 Tax=Geomonas sp. Red32 TaxID=2912856 RepID=UPI00202CBEE5|nr:hypothetical protein [Geomonas sp. Red32]MCM0083747.1 hypothetical protein [Geomonas sp. Red32]